MPLFRYKAFNAAGEELAGQMEAGSVDEVIVRLQDAGNLPIEAVPADQAGGGSFGALFKRAELSQDQILQFTQQLATLLGAGQPLDRALQILLDLPDSEGARRVIERIRDAVRGGAPLSSALEQEHGLFSRLYINIVRAGEVGGSLDQTLRQLAEYLERSKGMREQIINALIYPAILVIMVIASLFLLLGFVVPQFMPLFEGLGADLPPLTAVVLAVGDLLNSYWWLLVFLLVALIWWLRQQFGDPDKRLRFDGWLLGRKRIGDLVAKMEMARLARTLGTLVKNGVPLLGALTIARNVMGNRAMAAAVEVAAEDVKTGGALASSLARSKRFPRLAVQMVQVGEETGELDSMLLKVAGIFDAEVQNTIARMLSALVPLITIFMAGAISLIVMAILLPILSLSGAVG